eukprot:SAG11_NODE_32706_length_281_cov_1.131868_1_plen_67_part_10
MAHPHSLNKTNTSRKVKVVARIGEGLRGRRQTHLIYRACDGVQLTGLLPTTVPQDSATRHFAGRPAV